MNLFLTADVNFCASTANIWQIVGYVLLIFKIAIPILLIVFGMIDLGGAVVAGKSDEVTKKVKSLAFRAIAGVAVFLVPTVIGFVMGLVTDFSDSGAEKDFKICRSCLTRPNDCSEAKKAWK